MKEKLFLKETQSCLGENSVYDLLCQNDGKFMTFGGVGHTLTHYAEEKFNVNYRFHKIFTGKIIDELGNVQDKKIAYYVRKLDTASMPNLESIIALVSKSKNHKRLPLGGDFIDIYQAKEYVKTLHKALEKNKNILTQL
ncbi:AAC(3) family N-acetyltransferase [Campylobacter jejuni]|nr:AAC(3) family N-acetyltransferase [Campylobacter jejuni]